LFCFAGCSIVGIFLLARQFNSNFVTHDERRYLMLDVAPQHQRDFAGLHDLWNRDEPPAPDAERALMARFGMEPA
jgi:hypothetical protein